MQRFIHYLLIILLFSFYTISTFANTLKLVFNHLSLQDGMQNIIIHSIASDYQGFIWIGTQNGLHKFDGYTFTVYNNDNNDSSSIQDNNINQIIEDNAHNLWVGTNSGLDLFDRIHNRFIHIPLIEESLINGEKTKKIFKNYYINNIYKASNDEIYIGTRGSSLFMLDKKNLCIKSFHSKIHLPENLVKTSDSQGNLYVTSAQGVFKINPASDEVAKILLPLNQNDNSSYDAFDLYHDTNQNLWISCNKGLFRIDKNSKVFSYNNKSGYGNYPNFFIQNILEDHIGNIWFSSDNGLYLYNQAKDNLESYLFSNTEASISSNKVWCTHVDKNGILWVGTKSNGIDYALLNNKTLFHKKKTSDFIQNEVNSVSAIFKDENNIWLASDGGGMGLYDHEFNLKKIYNRNNIATNTILSIHKDRQGIIWMGGYYGGLHKLTASKTFEIIKIDKFFPTYLKSRTNEIKMIRQGINDNEIIVATNGAGILVYNKSTRDGKFFVNEKENNFSLCSDWCTCILPDKNGIVWIGTYNGLSKWDTKTNLFYNYYSVKNDTSSLPSNIIQTIYTGTDGKLWIGTNKGLCLFNEKTNKFINYGLKEGLPNTSVTNILQDDFGNLWISTFLGISQFKIANKKFTNYSYNDGLSGNEFMLNCNFKDKNGVLYFGGAAGFTYFNPREIINNNNKLPVYINEILLFNKPIQNKNYNVSLERAINETKKITLKHNQSFITFKYVALNYMNPKRIKYAYILNGFDKNWHYVNDERSATYSNLNPGKYIFSVKASYSGDQWIRSSNDIEIIIKPPFWKTIWAKLFYALTLGVIYFFILKINKTRNRLKQQLEVQKIKVEQEEKLHQHKQRFFMNISHDLRTPLSLIISPLENILGTGSLNGETKNQLSLVFRNANRLYYLINELMDFAKIDDNKQKLLVQEGDLIKFSKEVLQYFQDEANKKQINYIFRSSLETLPLWFDTEKMERILINILSNAFKYTQDHGTIIFEIERFKNENEYAKISISDNGSGIDEAYLPKIFDRFYQSPEADNLHQTGTGIGLSIVKTFVEMHKGSIKVTSKKFEKTCFEILLPLGKGNFSEDEVSLEPVDIRINSLKNVQTTKETNSTSEDLFVHKILIVEDNIDLRFYLKDILQNSYKIIEAEDGEKALSLVSKENPDLIISDIIMPNMNGIELCQKIKESVSTSHIPVILLTAKNSLENIIEGIEIGADAYISKPFNVQYLNVQVRKLIELRHFLFKRFSQEAYLIPKELSNNKVDQEFLQKIIEFIEQNIISENLTVDNIANHVFLSQSQTYRKIKGLTGQNINEFVRTIRMKKAVKLFDEGNLNISDVAFKVGFSSPAYFTKCFKELFGKTPSDFLSKNRQ